MTVLVKSGGLVLVKSGGHEQFLHADRDFYITELTAIKDRLGDTTTLEKERRILDE